MSNDFFNLNSDEESDEEEKKKKRETEKAIRKWDWDLEENFELYYSGEQKQTKEADSKRFKSESQHSASNFKPKTSNAISAASCNLIHNKNPYIEKVDPKSSSSISKKSTKLLYNLNGHSAPVNRIHWRKGYLNKPILLSSSMDRKIIIWDLSNPITAKSVRLFENVHSKGIRNAIWSLNQTEIVSVSYDQTCALTDAENGKEKNRIELSDILTAVCIHPTNEYLIQIGSKNCIYTWDIREKATNKTYNAPMGLVQDIVFMNNDEFISCGDVVSKESAMYSVIVWDMGSGARLSDQIFHEKFICTSLAIHPHRALFYAQTHGNYIAEFASRPPFKMNRHRRFESGSHLTQGYYIGCNIDPSGGAIASGSADGRVFVYSLESGQMVERIDAFSKQPCLDVKFRRMFSNESSDSDIYNKSFLAASSWTGLIRVFQF